MNKILLLIMCLFLTFMTFGQTSIIEGHVITTDNQDIVGAYVSLSGTNMTTYSDEQGVFKFDNLKGGTYQLIVTMTGYENYFSEDIKLSDNSNQVITVYLTAQSIEQDQTTTENTDDLANEQGSENISSLLSSSRDVFLSAASYSLGPMRFRIRGYESEFTDITLNSISMSNLETGRTYWSNWGGLNNITKNKIVTFGLDASDYTFGNVGGNTNITMQPSKYRKGLQVTYSLTNRSYRQRAMVTYSTGLMQNDWAFTFSGSRRWANEGYVEGTFYDSWSYYMGLEKHLKKHTIIFNFFGSPTKRGKAGASVQEAYDLADNVYYNPYWGYQNGEKRNSRVAQLHLPTALLTHIWDINKTTKLKTSGVFRVGRNGSTALNWYNAADPRPDYYRYLPSYITNPASANAVANAFANDPEYRQLNWSEMYATNYGSFDTVYNAEGISGNTVSGKKAQYMIEERRYDQAYTALHLLFSKEISSKIKFDIGVQERYFVGKNFKIVNDLLGADYWLDIDKYAERDFGDMDSAQSNLLQPNHVVKKGDKFGYNYNSHINKTKVWGQIDIDTRVLDIDFAFFGEYTDMWREGLMKNGKFPENSYGNSKHYTFIDYGTKLGLLYKINGRNFVYAHVAYLTQAPTFRNAFVSPRTRDNTINNLVSEKIMSGDIGYSYRSPKVKASIKAFYTVFQDQSKVMSFYHDGYRNYVNYSMNGIDKTHQGIETAIEAELFTGFSVYSVLSAGYYYWTSRPEVTVTIDNSDKVLAEGKTVYAKNFLVSGTPQTAGTFGLKYRTSSYWFFDINTNYVDNIFLSFNPDRRTAEAVEYIQPDSDSWNEIIDQEQLPNGYTLNASIGKSFRFDYKYYLNINVSMSNILDNRNIITGGYEQLRYDVNDKNPNKFPPKYYYLYGRQYFINVSFRF